MKTKLNKMLNWELNLKQVQTSNQLLRGKVALTRSDNGALLNICSDQYRPFYNNDLLCLVRKIENISSFELEGFEEFGNGKKILAFLKNRRVRKLGQETVSDYLIIGNTHDTTSQLFAGMSNYMFRCKNQFSSSLYPLRAKHISGLNPNSIDPKLLLTNYMNDRNQLDRQVAMMINTPINEHQISRMINEILNRIEPIPLNNETESFKKYWRKKQIEKAVNKEMNELGQTIWGFYNGITFYTSNILQGKGGFGLTNGLSARINKIAWDVSMNNTQA